MQSNNRLPNAAQAVLEDPIVQLAAVCPLCALAALSPEAALSALSPVLRVFNPALNPAAALLHLTLRNPGVVIQAQATGQVRGRMNQVLLKQYLRRPTLSYASTGVAYPL